MIDIIVIPKDLKDPPQAAVEKRAFIAMGDASDAIAALERGLGKPDSFDLVIFCAKDFAPPPQALQDRSPHRPRAYHAPLVDSPTTPITAEETYIASQAANHAAQTFASGKRVLITCVEGKNRSGLVTALVHHMLTGDGGAAAVRHVRERRVRVDSPALANRSFVALLVNLAPKHGGRVRLAG